MDAPHWLKVQYSSSETFPVGQIMPTSSGDWVLYCLVKPVRGFASPKLFDLSVIDYLSESLPEVRRVVVHFRGAGETYTIGMPELAALSDDPRYQRTKGAHEFLVVPFEHWAARTIREPFRGPRVPSTNVITVEDRPRRASPRRVREQTHGEIST